MAEVTAGKRASEKRDADGELSREPRDPPSLRKFKADPVDGTRSLLQLRHRQTIDAVLADAEFVTALQGLAAKAAKSPRAAVALSRFALRQEFSSLAVAAIGPAGPWPEPSSFDARDRRRAADALERARPSWASLWLAKALLSALPSPDLRRFFACRLLLCSGGLAGAVDALAKSLAAGESGRKKAPRDHLTLVRELRSCATPAAASTAASAFVEFIGAVTTGRPVADLAPVKLELAQLLLGAAAVDRGLVLDDKVLEIATTLDHDVAAELRTKAAGLLPREQKSPEPLPRERKSPEPLPREQKSPSAAPNQAELMREAASTDADQALGRALQDMGALARQFEQLEAAVEGQAADRARRAKGASELVLQWVRQAARHRSMEALGKRGERVPFDPEVHQAEDEASPGDYVRVLKPPIVRASGSQRIVIVRGEVELD